MKFFFVFGKSLPLFPEWLRAQSFFQCRAQSFFLCTELFPVRRAFSCAQSFFLCAELFPVHRAFSCAQSFLPCTELSVVHRAFRCAQSFLLCTELSAVHRALFWQPLQPWFVKETAFFFAKAQKLQKAALFAIVCRFPLLRLETHVLPIALCKSTRIRLVPNSGDSLPVFALECFSAFDTGGLGLWLGAFGRSRLYRCQSVPGPPMPCFVAQSFVLAAFATLVCQRNCGFSLQRHKT